MKLVLRLFVGRGVGGALAAGAGFYLNTPPPAAAAPPRLARTDERGDGVADRW